MKGAIIGDICGSIYEFNNASSKNVPLLTKRSTFTDDTVMTVAVMDWLLDTTRDIRLVMKEWASKYPNAGYGRKFYDWVLSDDMEPYYSCGNGAAMRISPVGWYARDIWECMELSNQVTKVTHNHPAGLKGAECTARLVEAAKVGMDKEYLAEVFANYYSDSDIYGQTLEEMRIGTGGEHGKEICQFSVPQAIQCFLYSNSFEDCIRNCISIGGDTDTICAIAGGIAEAFYGKDGSGEVDELWKMVVYGNYIPYEMVQMVEKFYGMCEKRAKLWKIE